MYDLDSDEYPQHVTPKENVENYPIFIPAIQPYLELWHSFILFYRFIS